MTDYQQGGLPRRTFLKRTGQLGALALAANPTRAFAIATGVTPNVETTEGPVRGLLDDGVHTFLGIPYATPPLGKLRFWPPALPNPHKGVFDAIRLGHASMQLSSGGSAVSYPGRIGPALSQVYGSRNDLLTQHEDCLVLNVWSPGLKGEKRPVMVWFHGGGFNYGSGSWPAYDGHNLAKNNDVVVVTVNHRLNAFGFLNLAEVWDDYADSGIVGQLDLVRSLEWVRDNIESFGGDAGNVTIFGQSGGGAKVSTLHAMPHAKGLFHKCIIQSGAGLRVGEPFEAAEVAAKVLRELDIGRDQQSRLMDIPAAQIQAAAIKVGGRYGPILNRTHIPEHPFDERSRAISDDIPVMVGFTKDEMTLYNVGFEWWRNLTEAQMRERVREQREDHADALIAAYQRLHPDYSPRHLYTAILTSRQFESATTLAERKTAQKSGPAYLYSFNWDAPVDDGILKSPHTMEIPFIFDNVDKGPMLLGTDRATQKLGSQMSKVWSTFARTGDPNTRGIPKWAPYETTNRATMVFDNKSRAIDNYMGEVRPLLRLRS
ncbi:MAG: carboxylesterase/lipase family protein [Pseudomonadota bacterium]